MKYLLVLCTITLSACGGAGNSDNGCWPAPQLPHTNADIVTYGDSTMAGEGPMLQEAMIARGYDVRQDNRGIGNSVLHNALNGDCKYGEKIRDVLPNDRRTVYVLENFGLNDANKVSPTQYEADLREFVSLVQGADKVAVIVTPNKVLGNASYDASVKAFAGIGRTVAEDTGALLIDVNADITLSQQQMSDSVHPAGSGYYVIVGYIAGKLIADIEARK